MMHKFAHQGHTLFLGLFGDHLDHEIDHEIDHELLDEVPVPHVYRAHVPCLWDDLLATDAK